MDVVDNSKQSKPRALDHHMAPPIQYVRTADGGQWQDVLVGINTAYYCEMAGST